MGQSLVFSYQLSVIRKEVSIDVSGLLPGLYFLRIDTGGEIDIQGVIIQ